MKNHSPMASKDLKQLELLVDEARMPRAEPMQVPVSEIMQCETRRDAIVLSVDKSRLQHKQIYSHLRIDPSQWNKILTSRANHFPDDEQWLNFLKITNNMVAPIWDLEQCGWDTSTLRRHGSDLEKENERLRQEIADRDKAIAFFIKAAK